MTVEEKSILIKSLASEAGFNACGITKAVIPEKDIAQLKTWLNAGYNAEMGYMSENYEKRINPRKILETAKSAIVVILNYFSDKYPERNKSFKITRYAVGDDYHFVLKKKLQFFNEQLRLNFKAIQSYSFSDPEPVLAKALAREAGLGWIGKNSLLVNNDYGSFLFIRPV